MEEFQLVCLYCEKGFKSTNPKQNTCSSKCQNAIECQQSVGFYKESPKPTAQNIDTSVKPPPIYKCAICGRIFVQKVPGVFICSVTCENVLLIMDEPKGPLKAQQDYIKEKRKDKESIAEEAARIIGGDRRESYGAAKESFDRIAAAWNLQVKSKLSTPLTGYDVAMMMAMFKLMREANKPKRDNRVDMIGYLLLAEQILDTTP